MTILYYSPNSPYVKKVIVAARELGIDDKITTKRVVTDPLAEKLEHTHINPAGKVPTLVSDDGRAYFGSQTIVQYLDAIEGGGKLFSSDPISRVDEMTLESIADQILDSSLAIQYERTRRKPDQVWQEWINGQLVKIKRGLKVLYQRLPSSTEEVKGAKLPEGDTQSVLPLGGIAVACALWYLDKRIYDLLDWRAIVDDGVNKGAALAEWYERVSSRPSLQTAH